MTRFPLRRWRLRATPRKVAVATRALSTRIRFMHWWRTRVWRWQTAVVISVLSMGLSSLLTVALSAADERNEHANDRAHRELIRHFQTELQCRSEIGTDASNLEGYIGLETALGLVDVARNDDASLLGKAARIEDLARQLEPALDRRAVAVESCQPDETEP